MTVSTELCYAERAWTGAETSFTPGFVANAKADVLVYARDPANGAVAQLTLDVHFGVTLGVVDNAVTVTPIALPAAPRTLLILRNTPALQDTNFSNLSKYSPLVHTRLHDAAALRDGEDKFHRARSLKAPLGENLLDLAPIADRKLRYPKFDAAGQMVPGGLVADIEGGAVAGQAHAEDAAAAASRAGGFLALVQSLVRRANQVFPSVLAAADAAAASANQAAGFATIGQSLVRKARISLDQVVAVPAQVAGFAALAQSAARRAIAATGQAGGAVGQVAGFAALAQSAAAHARRAAASVASAQTAIAGYVAAASLAERRTRKAAAALTEDQIALKARVFN